MKRVFTVVGFLCAMLMAHGAFADNGAAVQSLSDQIVSVLGVALGAVLLSLINRGIAVFEKKTGVVVSENQRQQLNSAVEQAIHFAEEQTHKAVKNKLSATTLPPKIEMASQFVLDLADSMSLSDMTKEKAQKLIEARLGAGRNGKGTVLSLVPSRPQSSPSQSPSPSPESSPTSPPSVEIPSPESTPPEEPEAAEPTSAATQEESPESNSKSKIKNKNKSK
jgi:RNase P/RNase MRP subunit POP5